MATQDVAPLTDEQRRAHFSELGQRAVEARRRRKAALGRVITETRRAQGIPADVSDIEVLDLAADLIRNTREAA